MRKILPAIFFLLTSLLTFLMTSPAFAADFHTEAYIPWYRLKTMPGASNALGRPLYDTAPRPWKGALREDFRHNLPLCWEDDNWTSRLSRDYNGFYLHVPLQTFLETGHIPPSLLNFMSYLKEKDASVFLSLIGHSEHYLPLSSTPEALREFAEDMGQLCATVPLDGIDIDWEFASSPGKDETQGFTLLADALREALPAHALLSAAFSRYRMPPAEAFEKLDRIHLMAYDGYGRHATFEAAVADSEILIARSGIARDKLILGLPFYGRIYSEEDEDYYTGTMHYRDIADEFSPSPEDDEAGGYYYNGPRTTGRKTAWAVESGLGGVFVWEPFYDASGARALTRAIHAAIQSAGRRAASREEARARASEAE